MSQKAEKPTLSGQRIKTRKRDEKEKFDSIAFRDAILQGLGEDGSDLDAVSKFLDNAGSKLDYRRYGESLFDILIAGGLLAPGGTILTDGDSAKPFRTNVCVFSAPDNLEVMRGYAQVFIKLTRRYKYLEKILEEEMKKILVFLKGFGDQEKHKLAMITAILISSGLVSAGVLTSLYQEHLVKEGVALEFIIDVFQTWIKEKDTNSVAAALRKAGLDSRLMEFFPVNKRSTETFEKTFTERGLGHIVVFQKMQENAGVKRELQKQLATMIKEEQPAKDIIIMVKEFMLKYSLPEHEIVVLVWNTLMGSVEWNKKEELVAEQALKHLKQYTPLTAAFTVQARSELALMVRIQEFCFDNMNFMKVFQKIVVVFYKAEVLSEDAILKWYKEAHLAKGKSIFLEQLKKFVEWLQNAEEESESGEEED
ncbi:Basic leucine zipper and W2 domain-containing protein 1 [Chamberlinius hualienensis]